MFALSVLMWAASVASPEVKTVSIRCEVGPVERTFGGGPWKVYSCSDGVTVVLISANSKSNVPFTYMLSLSRPAPYMFYGSGVPGEGTDVAAATQELRQLRAEEIAALISATKVQSRGDSSQPER